MDDEGPPEKKLLDAFKTWRGEIKVNRHIAAGMAVLYEGTLWCGGEKDRQYLINLIRTAPNPGEPVDH